MYDCTPAPKLPVPRCGFGRASNPRVLHNLGRQRLARPRCRVSHHTSIPHAPYIPPPNSRAALFHGFHWWVCARHSVHCLLPVRACGRRRLLHADGSAGGLFSFLVLVGGPAGVSPAPGRCNAAAPLCCTIVSSGGEGPACPGLFPSAALLRVLCFSAASAGAFGCAAGVCSVRRGLPARTGCLGCALCALVSVTDGQHRHCFLYSALQRSFDLPPMGSSWCDSILWTGCKHTASPNPDVCSGGEGLLAALARACDRLPKCTRRPATTVLARRRAPWTRDPLLI